MEYGHGIVQMNQIVQQPMSTVEMELIMEQKSVMMETEWMMMSVTITVKQHHVEMEL